MLLPAGASPTRYLGTYAARADNSEEGYMCCRSRGAKHSTHPPIGSGSALMIVPETFSLSGCFL